MLRPIVDGFKLLGNPVNSLVYPFPWFSTLHAARISLAFQSNTYRQGTYTALGWKSYIGGFCVMSWGGMVFSHILLNLPPPVLYASQVWFNYISIHLFLTAVFSLIPFFLVDADLLSTVDLVLFPLDAMLRVNAVSSSGGFTPTFLRKGPRSPLRNALSTLDIWGGGLAAIVYGLSTSHTAFHPLLSVLSPYIYAFALVDMHDVKPSSPLEGKSLAAAVLVALFGIRALAAKLQVSTPAAATNKEKK
ncbi:hypothetical protein F5050DRAFT_879848 [Lentinula boryana]|uniref:Uncharacterized protein n=1 Tax=Lentinula boryana TaxID=40481 RepID=A0ABQ8QMN1_9AGAR|nr:hypothetical protein F5050DRAFT_879848 [Lentinula boryana]